MPTLPISSTDCGSFRLEWRPSRWEAGLRLVLPPLAAFAFCASAPGSTLPGALRFGLAAVAFAWGLWEARRHLARPGEWLTIDAGNPPMLHEPWPLLLVRPAGGGPTRVFWPDTLSPAARRALRLAARRPPARPGLSPDWMA